MSSKFEMTYLVAVTIAISKEMEEFHYQEVRAEMRGVTYPKTSHYPKLVFQVWHPFWTRGIPTALCLN